MIKLFQTDELLDLKIELGMEEKKTKNSGWWRELIVYITKSNADILSMKKKKKKM